MMHWHLEEEEEVNERNKRNMLFDHFSSSPEAFYNFTGFTIDGFKKLFHIVEQCFTVYGRGQKPKFTIIDQFLMFLHFLKHYLRTKNLKVVFQIEPSTFENLFCKIENAQNCVITSDTSLPDCCYVVDATVQQICRPSLDW